MAETTGTLPIPWSGKPRSGSLRLLSVGGVPIYLNRSFLVASVLVCVLSWYLGGNLALDFILYALVVLVHESGHAIAARSFGLRVHAIEISAGGGLCHIDLPQGFWSWIFAFGGGVMGQAVVLVGALAWISFDDGLMTSYSESVGKVLVFFNAFVILGNLASFRDRRGNLSDGAVLKAVLMHRFRRGPAPGSLFLTPSPLPASPVFARNTRLAALPGFAKPGFASGLEMLNDNTTPMDFVVDVLERHVGMDRDTAVATMLEIHGKGGILLPTADLQAAEVIARTVGEEARSRQHLDLVIRAVGTRTADEIEEGAAFPGAGE
jgi:ATP-dependent Clp protease adapter protein ClpS